MYKFSDAPKDIREYLGSSKAAIYIDEINKKADIARINLISDLLYEIVVKETPPNYIAERLKEKIGTNDEEKAKSIAREIKEKILQPIYYAFLNWGVDINDIDTGDAPTLDEFVKKEAEFLESLGVKTEEGEPTQIKEETIRPEKIEDDIPIEQSIKINIGEIRMPTAAPNEIHPSEDAPLMLQREKEFISPTRKGSSSKGFSLPFGFFKKPLSSSALEPVKAKIESFDATDVPAKDKIKEPGFFNTLRQIKKDVEGEQKKVVHYSELRTPVTPFTKEEEFINLETFGMAPGADTDYLSKNEETPIEGEGKNNDYDDDEKKTEEGTEKKKSPWVFSFIPKLRNKGDKDNNSKNDDGHNDYNNDKNIKKDNSNNKITATTENLEKPKIDAVQIKTENKNNDDNYDDDKNGGKKKGTESGVKTKTLIWKMLFSKKLGEKKEENSPLFPITGKKMSEAPKQPEDESEKGPKIEGNTVDLRSNY